MILTEEEAKTKRCQESFGPAYTTPDGRSMMAVIYGAGYAVQASPSHCIGSGCMAWRWQHKPNTELCTTKDGEYPMHGTGWKLEERSPNGATYSRIRPGEGYCGKAGNP